MIFSFALEKRLLTILLMIILYHYLPGLLNSYWKYEPLNLKMPLIHFMRLVSFYTLCKHQKTFSFLMFSGGMEKEQWHEMD